MFRDVPESKIGVDFDFLRVDTEVQVRLYFDKHLLDMVVVQRDPIAKEKKINLVRPVDPISYLVFFTCRPLLWVHTSNPRFFSLLFFVCVV